MRIVLASSSSGSRGGGELYLLYLGRALAERGHEVILWCARHPRMDELSELFAPIGRVVRADYTNMYDRRLRSLASYWDHASARAAAESWRVLAPDVVHLNKQNLEDALDLQRAANALGVRTLATIHITQSAAYLRAKNAAMRDWVSRRALRQYRGPLVAVMEERARDLRSFLGSDARIHTVDNGVKLYDISGHAPIRAAKRAELGIAADAVLFAAVGRMVSQKRPLLFLETAERIVRAMPQARFIWVGDGPLANEWDAWVTARGLGAVIQRLGWQRNVRDFLFAADVFLHTAEFEGLPLALLEALSAGLPCAVAANLLAEMPFLSPENSIALGADESWLAILNDPARRAAIGAAGRQLAEGRFSFARMAEQYERLYNGASNSPN